MDAAFRTIHLRRPLPPGLLPVRQRWWALCDLCTVPATARTCANYVAQLAEADTVTRIEAICTFHGGGGGREQQAIVYMAVRLDVAEEALVRAVLERLETAARAEALTRISVEHLTFGDVDGRGKMTLLPFLNGGTYGTYDFQADTAADNRARRWAAFRTAYVDERRRSLASRAAANEVAALLDLALEHSERNDVAAAAPLLERAIAKGSADAMVRLGEAYLLGAPGFKASPSKSLVLLKQAAEDGDANTAGKAAVLLSRHGLDPSHSHASLERAAGLGHGPSAFELGRLCETGTGVAAVDLAGAVRWYERAHALGDLAGSTSLARCLHLAGATARAMTVCCEAIARHDMSNTPMLGTVMATLGKIYGDQGDWPAAVAWFNRGVHNHRIMAYEELSACYRLGDGVAADPTEAKFLKAVANVLSENDDQAYLLLMQCTSRRMGSRKDGAAVRPRYPGKHTEGACGTPTSATPLLRKDLRVNEEENGTSAGSCCTVV